MTFSDDERRRLIGDAEVEAVAEPTFKRSGLVASLLGMLAGLGMLVLLIATLSAGAILLDLEFDLLSASADARDVSIVGIIIAAVVTVISTLIGGYVAGRIARYGGIIIGLGSSLWLVLVLLLFTGTTLLLGRVSGTFDGFDLADRLSRFGSADLIAVAAITGGGLFLLALLGGLVGGRLGQTQEKDPITVVDIREDNADAEEAEPAEEPTLSDEPETEPVRPPLPNQQSTLQPDAKES